MINIKNISLILAILTFFNGCIEPNAEELWSVSVENVLMTEGFARDVDIYESFAIVASGQSGIQVWDLSNQTRLSNFTGYYEGGSFLEFDDINLVGVDTLNKLIFSSESNKDVKIFHYDGEDTIRYRNTIMSAKTKEFISFANMKDEFYMFSADNDDGIKWHRYDLDSTSAFGIDFVEWTPFGGDEIYTPGKPEGIDSDGGSLIALAVDQMGVELYSIDSLGADPTFLGRIGTEGNAEKVELVSEGVFASCDDAGAYYIPIDNFTQEKNEVFRFATDFTVDHIAINNIKGIAALSLGSKGIALYDISDPKNPVERGLFSIGYTYSSVFWNNSLVVCSREGLQIISIFQ